MTKQDSNASTTQMKNQSKKLAAAIETKQTKTALLLFEEGLGVGPDTFIAALRKHGVLRSSRYNYDTSILKRLLLAFHERSSRETFSEQVKVYLSSVGSLLFLADGTRGIYKKFREGASSKDFKSLLVGVDDLFWRGEPNRYGATMKPSHEFYREDLAMAFSFLAANRKGPLEPKDWLRVDCQNIANGRFVEELSEVAKLNYFKEAEVMVDHYGFVAVREKNVVEIRHPDSLFEKCRRLGYMRDDMQQAADTEAYGKDSANLEEFVKEFVGKSVEHIFIVSSNPDRISLKVPSEQFIRPFLEETNLLHDEQLLVAATLKHQSISLEEFKTTPVHGDITLLDLVKVRRLFCFMQSALKIKLATDHLIGTATYYHSIVPVVTRELLVQLLALGLGDKKAEQIAQLLSWDSEKSAVFDIQAQPLIACGPFVWLPLGILARSYLVRNVLQNIRFRFDAADEKDPIGDMLTSCLSEHFPNVFRNIAYSFLGLSGEIDCLARSGNQLFAFECKNSLHPCNIFEMRTTMDYIRKAAEQLDRFQQAWRLPGFREYLGSKLDVEMSGTDRINTCIVMGNRMFGGWREGVHIVRSIHELLNLMGSGGISFVSRIDPERPYSGRIRLWKDNHFAADDLRISLDGPCEYQLYLDSMVEVDEKHRIHGRFLSFRTYYLDLLRFSKEFRQHPAFELTASQNGD